MNEGYICSYINDYVSAKLLQSGPTLCAPVDYSPPGGSVHGILQEKNTGVGCHAHLQGIFPAYGANLVSHIAGRFFTVSATREAYT